MYVRALGFVMKKVLGMDISSSTIGWSLLEVDGDKVFLSKYGHLKPPNSKSGSLTFRINSAYSKMKELFDEIKPDIVAIEAYANKFSAGRSSARTIMVLSVFNELSALACLRTLNIEPVKYSVITIRSKISKYYNEDIKSKDDVFDYVSNYFKDFKVVKNRNGGVKKECYDEADATAVALCYIISNNEE